MAEVSMFNFLNLNTSTFKEETIANEHEKHKGFQLGHRGMQI